MDSHNGFWGNGPTEVTYRLDNIGLTRGGVSASSHNPSDYTVIVKFYVAACISTYRYPQTTVLDVDLSPALLGQMIKGGEAAGAQRIWGRAKIARPYNDHFEAFLDLLLEWADSIPKVGS